ncbi:two-component sensor histidine kinase [Deltaproteobacteria bacterium Smac51]|nr:two-component sensor histidine kinase [Deltaproteobacteria bacterium Smac51]
MSSAAPRNRRPSLRVMMILVGLIILAMPISGLYLFRIYENELVRQTETELIAQAALIGAMYKSEVLKISGPGYGRRLSGFSAAGASGPYRLMPPRLDLSRDAILERGIHYRPSLYDPDPVALEAAAHLEAILDEAGRTTLSSVVLLDFHGLVVGGKRGQGLSLSDNPEVSEALSGNYYSVLRTRDTRKWVSLSSPERGARFRVFFAMPVMNRDRLIGVVYLSRTPREVLKALYHQEAKNLILSAILTMGLMAAISLISSLMIVGPVKRLAAEAKSVAEGGQGGFSDKAPLIVVRELAELRAVVADMAERLRRRSDYLKAFASGVSHEFKTPLTSIKGAMELISEHGSSMDEATRIRFENNIKNDLDRLEKLVMRLLALARAEAVDPAGDDRANAIELSQNLVAHYRQQGFTVGLETSLDSLELSVSTDVLETVLRNLIDNSRDSGADRIKLEIGLDGLQKNGIIRSTDNGPGIPPEAVDSIFKPFFTTRKNSGGTGLGLSLARTLLLPYRGELQWAGNDPGAVFIVTLPLSK